MANPVLDQARRAKHAAFVVRKRARVLAKRSKFDAATVAFRHVERVRPYRYRPRRYEDTFLRTTLSDQTASELPRRAFVIWAGDNELTPNRARNLEMIETSLGLPVELVSASTLERWLVPDHPLHAAYEHLSFIHRSDYLRGYLMHHHGGAYLDIKAPLRPWAGAYDRMSADPDAWVTSYPTTEANWIGKLRGRIGRDILIHYGLMFGKSGFMMRSHTPLTTEWMAQMHLLLDERSDRLELHPGGVFGDTDEYPMSWTDLLGRVLDPLTLKYQSHVRYDPTMLLEFENYR